jgi:hypothetical protein
MKGANSSRRWQPGRLLLVTAWLTVAAGTAFAQPQVSGVPVGPAEGQVIDRVVAIIEGQVLTQSELEFETRVAAIEQGAVQLAVTPLDEELLRNALELVIAHRLLVLSADRLESFAAEQAEVEERLVTFRRQFESEEAFQGFLARSGSDLKHLKEVLERNVRARRILDSRIRLRIQVGEPELRRYFEEHASDYPEGYEAAKRRLRDKLSQERYKALAAEELSQVRASAQVRRVAPFSRETRR